MGRNEYVVSDLGTPDLRRRSGSQCQALEKGDPTMKNREQFESFQNIISELHDQMGDLIGIANMLEIERLPDFEERVRSVVGEIENISHDLFQLGMKTA